MPEPAAPVRERSIAEILRLYGQGGGDVILYHPEPLYLLIGEVAVVTRQPLLEAPLDEGRVGFEHVVLAHSETHQRDEVGKQPLRGSAAHLRALQPLVRFPQGFGVQQVGRVVQGVGELPDLLQGQVPLGVWTAVDDLERCKFVSVLLYELARSW